MVHTFLGRYRITISLFLLSVFYCEYVIAAFLTVKKNIVETRGVTVKDSRLYLQKNDFKFQTAVKSAGSVQYLPVGTEPKAENIFLLQDDDGGPTQPEMESFKSVNSSNMVDLFTGDFSYNIPLMDVGGYPVNIAYSGQPTMDEDASWVGLGWNINPGTVNRNLRGLPDDFDGKDSIKKTSSVKDNVTVGVNAGANLELFGFFGISAGTGIFKNTYKGWGTESSIGINLSAGNKSHGSLTGGLGVSLKNNSQEGVTVVPSLSVGIGKHDADNYTTGNFSIAAPFNSRTGLKGLQVSGGINSYKKKDGVDHRASDGIASFISFASPTYSPTITMPYTSSNFTFSGKIGGQAWGVHPSFYISGYVSRQFIAVNDRTKYLPAYGYFNYQKAVGNESALLDFNREKEVPYREKPDLPNIAVPNYTYDVFSISGEGTGGSFRGYRGDIGYVHDHFSATKDESVSGTIDIGIPNLVHGGGEIGYTRSLTETGSWVEGNALQQKINFRNSAAKYEAIYLRNPGEKTINDNAFYKAIGGDDVVAVDLYQSGNSSSSIISTNYFKKYRNSKFIGRDTITAEKTYKHNRDKRSQVINYLTAEEASISGIDKLINIYNYNTFSLQNCTPVNLYPSSSGDGLRGEYYTGTDLKNFASTRIEPFLHFPYTGDVLYRYPAATVPGISDDYISARWTGYLRAPETGTFYFKIRSDDGINFWLNDSLVKSNWSLHPLMDDDFSVNLVKGQFYKLRAEFFEYEDDAAYHLLWKFGSLSDYVTVPQVNLYSSLPEVFNAGPGLTVEKRVNSYRKSNHISEIDVVNADGRRYIYGIPVYNFGQTEATFNVNGNQANKKTGLVKYSSQDNSTGNQQGKDWFFSSEDMPAYAHSFLLTGILSADYQDLTNDGITDDDPGDAIKFNYTRINGLLNKFKWRAPFTDSATYNEGLKTDKRDDKGSFIYGEKELWYLHSIVSKNMVATFTLEDRKDMLEITKDGLKQNNNSAKRLKRIDLYSKADLLKNGVEGAIPIKTVHFEYNYELCRGLYKGTSTPYYDTGKLTLKKIWFTYNNNVSEKKNPYVFNYNNNVRYNSKSYDRWGNYKNTSNNPNPLLNDTLTNAEYPYVIQDSVKANKDVAAWCLNEIKLPSGGLIKVQYESDDYAYVQNKRAMQMCKIEGFSNSIGGHSTALYSGVDNLYMYVRVPVAVTNKTDLYNKYLEGIDKTYFKVAVQMPSDTYGSGYEYIPGYASLDLSNSNNYGIINSTLIYVKMKGINAKADGPGTMSPVVKAALQYLRLNLPSKAFPGSEPANNVSVVNMVTSLVTSIFDIIHAFDSFDGTAREKSWCQYIDPRRSFVRLNNPNYRKYGGGARVKRIEVFDNWKNMTANAQKEASYGQDYFYTTTKEIAGKQTVISSGVARYEPLLGGEENPFRIPLEYAESASLLAPITSGYVEEPLGEAFFPAPGIGYSKIRVRTIHYKNKRSANGYEESCFYTAYDFPTITEKSPLADNKKRYKSPLGDILKIDSKHFLAFSQGFKIELNDMHGKLKSQATYAETDAVHPISYTENFYKVDNQQAEAKHLSNEVLVMNPDSTISENATIGKDAELMVDMRQQRSVSNGFNLNLNTEFFTVGIWPIFLFPIFNLATREENMFRSIATVKIINRYGILDSILHIDKGSKISTKNMLYDAETGEVLLSRTQNEFNDNIYNFNYPAHWAYDNLSGAYKNINISFTGLTVNNGKITDGLPAGTTVNDFFAAGDEILFSSKPRTDNGTGCVTGSGSFSTFSVWDKRLWVIDTNALKNTIPALFFVDEYGTPVSGKDVMFKVIRSGRKNLMSSQVGNVTALKNPLVKTGTQYRVVINDSSKVINASAMEYRQFWKVAERKKQKMVNTCISDAECISGDTCTCHCLKQFFGYLLATNKIYTLQSYGRTVRSLVNEAIASGYSIDTACTILRKNMNGLFYSLTEPYAGDTTRIGLDFDLPDYKAVLGNCTLRLYRSDTARLGGRIPKLNMIFPQLCSNNNVYYSFYNAQYSFDTCKTYRISYHDTLPYWWVSYVACNQYGNHYYRDTTLNRTDTSFSFCADPYAEILAYAYNDTGYYYPLPVNTGSICRVDTTRYYPFGYLGIESCNSPDSCYNFNTGICYNPITDTTVNPYLYGLLGNWRPGKSYVYYTNRAETNTDDPTDIRRFGTYGDFKPFWKFESGKLKPQYLESRWVWKSEQTLFNGRGFELENRDPLGRYNSGLYGYNHTMPVAVTQNSRYEQAAFEGFEDYNYGSNACDQSCPTGRHFDFGSYKSSIDSTQSHTGKYSIRISSGSSVSIGAKVKPAPDADPSMSFDPVSGSCSGLKGAYASSTILLPNFTLYQNTKMLFSAWVREQNDSCYCTKFSNNQIDIGKASGNQVLYPTGMIIDGWQRYEGVFELTSADTAVSFIMRSTGTNPVVYFDDIRIHPFNANMKSFVFHDINMRLMAELDENNYATFYEYDDDGTLNRVKKETARGIKTIRETRSALLKQ